MAKQGFYNARRECRMHEGEIAAVCPRCYELALAQQERQVMREREQAHAEWLREQQGRAA